MPLCDDLQNLSLVSLCFLRPYVLVDLAEPLCPFSHTGQQDTYLLYIYYVFKNRLGKLLGEFLAEVDRARETVESKTSKIKLTPN